MGLFDFLGAIGSGLAPAYQQAVGFRQQQAEAARQRAQQDEEMAWQRHLRALAQAQEPTAEELATGRRLRAATAENQLAELTRQGQPVPGLGEVTYGGLPGYLQGRQAALGLEQQQPWTTTASGRSRAKFVERFYPPSVYASLFDETNPLPLEQIDAQLRQLGTPPALAAAFAPVAKRGPWVDALLGDGGSSAPAPVGDPEQEINLLGPREAGMSGSSNGVSGSSNGVSPSLQAPETETLAGALGRLRANPAATGEDVSLLLQAYPLLHPETKKPLVRMPARDAQGYPTEAFDPSLAGLISTGIRVENPATKPGEETVYVQDYRNPEGPYVPILGRDYRAYMKDAADYQRGARMDEAKSALLAAQAKGITNKDQPFYFNGHLYTINMLQALGGIGAAEANTPVAVGPDGQVLPSLGGPANTVPGQVPSTGGQGTETGGQDDRAPRLGPPLPGTEPGEPVSLTYGPVRPPVLLTPAQIEANRKGTQTTATVAKTTAETASVAGKTARAALPEAPAAWLGKLWNEAVRANHGEPDATAVAMLQRSIEKNLPLARERWGEAFTVTDDDIRAVNGVIKSDQQVALAKAAQAERKRMDDIEAEISRERVEILARRQSSAGKTGKDFTPAQAMANLNGAQRNLDHLLEERRKYEAMVLKPTFTGQIDYSTIDESIQMARAQRDYFQALVKAPSAAVKGSVDQGPVKPAPAPTISAKPDINTVARDIAKRKGGPGAQMAITLAGMKFSERKIADAMGLLGLNWLSARAYARMAYRHPGEKYSQALEDEAGGYLNDPNIDKPEWWPTSQVSK